ncbi:MAG: nucleotide exchange factor GrpE [Clostridia bacterium]|nr:nucleotide exchange factor GrpE [Clostridia bacterium]
MSTEETKVTPDEAQEPVEEKEPKAKKKKADKKAEVEKLTAEIEKLNEEIAALKDTHLRTLAEYSNFRNRSQREKEALYGDAKANTLKTLLPVIDNFDRATDNKTDDIEAYRKGIEMTFTQLKDILGTMEVEAFGEVGDEFDPNIHNAVMTVENPDLPENTIAGVFEKGYRMGDRILRFATVQVTN